MTPETHDIDADVRLISASASLKDLLATDPTYCPSIRADVYGEPALRVARAFDQEVKRLGQARSSYVYFKRRDGSVGTSWGEPRAALNVLLRKLCSDERLTPADRIRLRDLVQTCPFDADWLGRAKARLARHNGPRVSQDAVQKAVGLVFLDGGEVVAISPRGRVRLLKVHRYAASYVKQAGALARLDVVADITDRF